MLHSSIFHSSCCQRGASQGAGPKRASELSVRSVVGLRLSPHCPAGNSLILRVSTCTQDCAQQRRYWKTVHVGWQATARTLLQFWRRGRRDVQPPLWLDASCHRCQWARPSIDSRSWLIMAAGCQYCHCTAVSGIMMPAPLTLIISLLSGATSEEEPTQRISSTEQRHTAHGNDPMMARRRTLEQRCHAGHMCMHA